MARYKPDHKSMGRFLLSRQLNRPVTKATREIYTRLLDSLPRETGHLSRSYSIRRAISSGPFDLPKAKWEGGPRLVQVIESSDPAAVGGEFGNSRTPERRYLRRAGAPYHTPLGGA